MLKNISICILDGDAHYVKAFMGAVALDYTGFEVRARAACGDDCAGDVDVCVGFGLAEGIRENCGKAFVPTCGRYGGVGAVLAEAKAFAAGRVTEQGAVQQGRPAAAPTLRSGTLVCVYACAGGIGASAAAIGIGRELARYRGERALYLSLEDSEDPGLFPPDVRAMRAEEAIYRYLRLVKNGASPADFERLFHAAAACDEYGLYRLAPDDGPGSLASLATTDVRIFLGHFAAALGLTRVVLDFGTRLHALAAFACLLEEGEAFFLEALSDGDEGDRKRKAGFGAGEPSFEAAFPRCEEDIRKLDGGMAIGLANAFGLVVKEVCDRIVGEGYEHGR
ncbi:MAG: hypothetical protein FWH32_03055 [Clostridiales bacterium]|nr:hypothetical protein [Clostridiales bacterium]